MSKYAQGTSVPVDRSQAEIQKTLTRYGATHFVCGTEPGAGVVGFTAQERTVKLRLPLPDAGDVPQLDRHGRKRSDAAVARDFAALVRQRWRALALIVKAKCEAIESGIATFDEEWLAYRVLADGRTVGEVALPQLALAGARVPQLTLRVER